MKNSINRKLEYALMALKVISERPDELVSVKEVCEGTGAPFEVTSKVMQLLARKRILHSEKGVHGGYRMTSSAKKLSLYDLIVCISGPIAVVRCLSHKDRCDLEKKCNVITPLEKLNVHIKRLYMSIGLMDLIRK